MVDEILLLKTYIESMAMIESILPNVTIILSQPIIRTDNQRVNNILKIYICKLNLLNIHILDNSNIQEEHLGKKGLHLNKRGTGKLALNIMSLIRQL